ncbi:ninjurin-2 isoform X2 [Sitodiplosis mosellana]|uniref:ninjurin-2 isoform X2 n=1 Tax=Sitodiplosis mosellana TaxID=263140 RepID=UPI0024449E1F|nr:ninjurin-2 isoform X2 [Sitodiplosis mosellana]
MKNIEQIGPQFLKREIEQIAPQIIQREVKNIAPKVIKTFTPWYIRWFYSLFGDGIRAMATSSIAPEGATTSDSVLKTMDANRYATKKTIAQGMLDIALLTANASQLKYILQVGNRHEFYTLMLILISLSIIMQVFSGVLNLSLSLMRDCRLHLIKFNNSANAINYLRSFLAFFIVFTNILVSAFDPTIAPDPLLTDLDNN